jgi:predicted permease
MALVLLIGAGLMIRTLAALWAINPGFDPHNVLTLSIALDSRLTASPASTRAAMREFHRTLAAVPGIEAASLVGGSLPMSGDSELPFWLDNEPRPAATQEMKLSLFYVVQPDYLRTMGIPLHRGRFFNEHDDERSTLAVVIDERLAQKYFAGSDPIGRYLNIEYIGKAQIVGIAGHVKHFGLDTDATAPVQPQMYLPILQTPDQILPLLVREVGVAVRSDAPAGQLTERIRRAIAHMNSRQVMWGVQTMEEIIRGSLAARRFSMFLLGVFAALALLLSSIGVYGVISYLVGERTHEIGIRIALGAQHSNVLRLMLGEGLRMAGAGVVIGLVAAFGLTRVMSGMLFGVRATDPVTFAGVALLLTAVALAACYVPARRAMRVDPIVALRHE